MLLHVTHPQHLACHGLWRRRGSQGVNPSKGGRPYFIPTTAVATKSKSGDSHGGINPPEWEKPSVDPCPAGDSAMATSMVKPSVLTKAASEGSGENSQTLAVEKERKVPPRSCTQPEGTFAYTVDKNDTLTSIAARFETTPSELVKINRLVSRLICPGKVIYVPEKSNSDNEVNPQSPSKERAKTVGSPPSQIIQESPKPGRAERVCDSPSPPHRVTVKLLTKEEEQKLDQDCIERFLKINNVKHITDGRGVVGGVLLVTPNAAMFEPSVMEPLVTERGVEKYYVNAPLKTVANAAIYTDIAHMKVRNAPQITAHLPPPMIYYPRTHPCYKSQASQGSDADGELLDGAPKRSESQQAVKGSISDKTDLDLSEEEDDNHSIGGLSDSRGSDVQSLDNKSVTSEVFSDEKTEVDGFAHKMDSINIDYASRAADPPLLNGLRRGSDGDGLMNGKGVAIINRVFDGDYNQEVPQLVCIDAEANAESTHNTAQQPSLNKIGKMDSARFEKQDGYKRPVSDLPNGKVPSLEDITERKDLHGVKKKSPSGLGLLPFLTDSLWSMSQSAPTTKEEAAVLQNALNRKHSIPDVQQTSEKSRLKMLKRLSYPLWSSEAPEKDKSDDDVEESQLESSDKDASQGPSGQNPLYRILNTATPRNFVDFSSGLFQRSNDSLAKVEDISHFQRQTSYSLPSPGIEGWMIPSKAFFSERRGSSPESIILETVNPHTGLGRRFSDSVGSKTDGKHSSVNSKEDIRIEFKSEVALEDKKELFQSIDEIVPVPARSCDDPPLYLCLRMGRSMPIKAATNSPSASNNKQEKRQKPLKSEYWFSIPKDRVDELFHFIQQWAPGVYGELDQVDYKQRGLELISLDELSDEDETEELSTKVIELSAGAASKKIYDKALGESHPDWEVVSMKDVHEPAFGEMSLEIELPPPELIGETEILTDQHRRAIFKILPPRAEGYSWSLIFSASQHGFSLQSLYRTMAKYETPVLLIIQDTENNVFGAMTSCILKMSDHFYGNGESFLFTFFPEFKVFKWTGENVFFIKGNTESLAIGAGEGLFGLWLDGDLYHGRSHCCKTYNNDTLSNREDFCVKLLEAWGFVEFGVQDSIC